MLAQFSVCELAPPWPHFAMPVRNRSGPKAETRNNSISYRTVLLAGRIAYGATAGWSRNPSSGGTTTVLLPPIRMPSTPFSKPAQNPGTGPPPRRMTAGRNGPCPPSRYVCRAQGANCSRQHVFFIPADCEIYAVGGRLAGWIIAGGPMLCRMIAVVAYAFTQHARHPGAIKKRPNPVQK